MTSIPAADTVLVPTVALYMDLHRHPELSGAEERTAARLAGWLREDGLEVACGVGGHGVVGLLRNGPGPTVMLRAELDALPVAEQTGLPYASPTAVMHACGHDLHTAALAGATRLLAGVRDDWRGTLMVVGQPAEETLIGAQAMLDDGFRDRFGTPSAVLAQHLIPMPAGMVAHTSGPMLAGSLTLRVVVHGTGSHVAAPQHGVDAVVAAAAIVMRLQTVVARESSPGELIVVSVGRISAGTAPNLIADQAELEVTLRALSVASLARTEAAVRRIVMAEAAASGCQRPPEICVESRSPVLVPDEDLTATVASAHRDHFGRPRVTTAWPSLAAEDVGRFAESDVALCYWMLGSIGRTQWQALSGSTAERLAQAPPNHSPRFAPAPGPALSTGIEALTAAALTQLTTA
ncbi:amidohydrolase [Nocardioides insulae]|uniref:amidohydrolase n=1 Tax=Nocardioides insulae TaxID=394734 RepID=UPI000405F933|nr:amidohydrolase [Nocardioides insulae]